MKIKLILGFVCIGSFALSQKESDTTINTPEVKLTAFVDAYYAYDFNKPETKRQDFFFNHNRHNEFNINTGIIMVSVNHSRYRMNFGLHGGTFSQDNYAHEPVMFRNLYDANVGIALNKKENLWLDVGLFGSHMGFESSMSIDNPTLTRSFVAESSPYYLSGAKLTYNPNEKWEVSGIISNGWQRIQRVEGSSMISGGKQIIYKPKNGVVLNWSTFVTTEDPDTSRRYRYFSNIYGLFDISKKWHLIAGFDFGLEQTSSGASSYNPWYAPVTILQYKHTDKLQFAIRSEYFHDDGGIIIPVQSNATGFRTFINSFNIDYKPYKNVALRFEGRYLKSDDNIFTRGQDYIDDNLFFIVSLAVKLEKIL